MGNTVLVVEHDADMILASDHIVDLGPAAGMEGGYIVFQGTPQQILNRDDSLTGRYLSGKDRIPKPSSTRNFNGRYIILEGATENNLKISILKYRSVYLPLLQGFRVPEKVP